MSPTTSFELAQPSDIEQLLLMMETYYAYDDINFDAAGARRGLEFVIRNPHFGRIWLIQTGHAVVGYLCVTFGASLEYHGQDAFIDEVFIHEDYREMGIGTEAFELAEESCRSMGIPRSILRSSATISRPRSSTAGATTIITIACC